MKMLTKLGAAAVLAAAFAAGASAGETIEEIVVIGQRPAWSLPVELKQPTQSEIRVELELKVEPATPVITEPTIQLASVERRHG